MSSADSTSADVKTAAEQERLPCRGCTRDCANYATCDGRPWRVRHSSTEA